MEGLPSAMERKICVLKTDNSQIEAIEDEIEENTLEVEPKFWPQNSYGELCDPSKISAQKRLRTKSRVNSKVTP